MLLFSDPSLLVKPLPWADFWSIYCWTQVSGDQGMLQQRIHSWLGGVQERRNASGYVHFCAPMERGPGSCRFGAVKPVWGRWNVFPIFFWGGTGSDVFWGYSIDVWICIKISQPSNLYKVSVDLPQDLDATAAGAALHWANAARVAATSFLWFQEWRFLRWVANGTSW